MVFRAIGLLTAVLCLTGCSDDNDQKACSPIDPIQVNLGGNRYAIPASYQPRFEHKDGRDKTFYVFSQNYYQDGKRLKFRYCKRDGHQDVDGIHFHLEFGNNRRDDGYDTNDAIVSANSPRWDRLKNVSMISIGSVPASIDPKPDDTFYKDAIISPDGQFYFKRSSAGGDFHCKSGFISTAQTVFGGKIRGSCSIAVVAPYNMTWRLYISADRLIKPHGRVVVDLHNPTFEDLSPTLQDVRRFIASIQQQPN
jgi:hypothetical protein